VVNKTRAANWSDKFGGRCDISAACRGLKSATAAGLRRAPQWSDLKSKAPVAYFFGREIERWSEARRPCSAFPPNTPQTDPGLANGMLIAGLGRGIDIDRLPHAMLEAHWRDDADLADVQSVKLLVSSIRALVGALYEVLMVRKSWATDFPDTSSRARRGSPVHGSGGIRFCDDHNVAARRGLG
jgi:hypothetical protein